MKLLRNLLFLSLLIIALAGCGGKAQHRTAQQIGEILLNALASDDFPRLQECVTNEETYNTYRKALNERFLTDINPGFDSESYAGRLAETRTSFEQIRTTRAEQFGIDWNKTVLVAVTLSDNTSEFDEFIDYHGMEITIRFDKEEYRISTYGVLQTADGDIMLKPSRLRLVPR